MNATNAKPAISSVLFMMPPRDELADQIHRAWNRAGDVCAEADAGIDGLRLAADDEHRWHRASELSYCTAHDVDVHPVTVRDRCAVGGVGLENIQCARRATTRHAVRDDQ
jgi:hypothetical protein